MVFAGRAYQHLFWDSPFRSVLWDQNLLEPFVNSIFNMSWKDYVTDLSIDHKIQTLIRLNGWFYLFCAIVSLTIKPTSNKIFKSILFLGGCNLVVLALLLTKNKFYHFAMFFEHAIQFSVPFLLYYFLKNESVRWLLPKLKLIISISFVCHGLYAIGLIYPIPENFVTMTLNILPISEINAKQFLFIMGILDFVFAIIIFIPKLSKVSLIYAFTWGFITAIARVLSGLKYGVSLHILHQYFYQTLYRIPHGIIPLLTYLILKRNRNN